MSGSGQIDYLNEERNRNLKRETGILSYGR